MTVPAFPTAGIVEGQTGAILNWEWLNQALAQLTKPDGSALFTPGEIAQLYQPIPIPARPVAASNGLQVFDFAESSDAGTKEMNLTANCLIFVAGLVPGTCQRGTLRLYETGTGGFTVTFANVDRWAAGPFAGTSDPTGHALQAAYTDIQLTWDGARLAGQTIVGAPQVPDPPILVKAAPTTTGTVVLTWAPSRICGSDDPANALTGYRVTTRLSSNRATVVAGPTTITAPTVTATVGSLTNTTSYDFDIEAHTALGYSTIVTVQATPVAASTAPLTAPTNLTASSDDGTSSISAGAPTNDGGSAIIDYDLLVTAPGAGAPAVVQKIIKRLPANGLSISTIATDWTQPLAQGNKLIVGILDGSYTGTRTVTSTAANPTLFRSVDNSDVHIECWDHDIGASEGEPTITFTLSGTGAVAGQLCLIIYEVSGLGARDQSAAGPQVFADATHGHHFPAGTTAALGQADEWLLALFGFNQDSPTVSYVLNDGSPTTSPTDASFTNGASAFTQLDSDIRLYAASFHNTSGTTAVGVAAKTTTALNGIGLLCAWKALPSSFSSHNAAVTTWPQVVTAPNGPLYTVVVKARNTNGYGPTATTTFQHSTVINPNTGGGTIKTTRGMFAGGVPTQAGWTSMLGNWSAIAPVGSMSEQFAFAGIGGLSTFGSNDGWGIRDFYQHAGAAPRPVIFVDLAEFPPSPAIAGRPGFTLTQVGAGTADTAFHNSSLTGIADYLGGINAYNPLIRLAYECDQNWPAWAAEGHIAAFTTAWNRITTAILLYCPNAKFILNLSAAWGGGVASLGTHSHALWDSIIAGLSNVDYLGFDIYGDFPNNSTFGLTNAGRISWLVAELAMIRAWAIAQGKQIIVPEWGVSDTTHYNGVNSGNYAMVGTDFVQTLYNWFVALPASGAGSLLAQVPFDAYDPNNPGTSDWRGMRLVPGQAAAPPLYKQLFNA